MRTGPSVTASAPASMTDAERANALGELARLRAGGALTLGELAEAARRVHAGRTSSELEQAGLAASGGTIAAQAPFLGGAELDLRNAIVDGDEVSVTCVCLLGGVRLIVPEGVPVSFSGLSVLGGRSDERAPVPPLPGAPQPRGTLVNDRLHCFLRHSRDGSSVRVGRVAARSTCKRGKLAKLGGRGSGTAGNRHRETTRLTESCVDAAGTSRAPGRRRARGRRALRRDGWPPARSRVGPRPRGRPGLAG
jgi:hypothetical protein